MKAKVDTIGTVNKEVATNLPTMFDSIRDKISVLSKNLHDFGHLGSSLLQPFQLLSRTETTASTISISNDDDFPTAISHTTKRKTFESDAFEVFHEECSAQSIDETTGVTVNDSKKQNLKRAKIDS